MTRLDERSVRVQLHGSPRRLIQMVWPDFTLKVGHQLSEPITLYLQSNRPARVLAGTKKDRLSGSSGTKAATHYTSL